MENKFINLIQTGSVVLFSCFQCHRYQPYLIYSKEQGESEGMCKRGNTSLVFWRHFVLTMNGCDGFAEQKGKGRGTGPQSCQF